MRVNLEWSMYHLVSEVQDEYDIWKAQFPKNLERAEIQHAQK